MRRVAGAIGAVILAGLVPPATGFKAFLGTHERFEQPQRGAVHRVCFEPDWDSDEPPFVYVYLARLEKRTKSKGRPIAGTETRIKSYSNEEEKIDVARKHVKDGGTYALVHSQNPERASALLDVALVFDMDHDADWSCKELEQWGRGKNGSANNPETETKSRPKRSNQ